MTGAPAGLMSRTHWMLPMVCFGLAVAARRALRPARRDDLYGNVALITGSSRGLGLAIARELAREGCSIVLTARDAAELERARSDVQSVGAEVLVVPCDVTRRDEVRHLIAAATDRFGRIDILVNNAGAITAGPLEAASIEDFERAMDVMFWGTLYPTFEVLPHMRARRAGHVVNVTSIGGKVSVPHLLPYSSAKFAAIGFSEGLHAAEAANGIRVLTVVPGLMRTGSHVNAEFKGQQRKEFAWFSLAASLPATSIAADAAARRIVAAIRSGESEIVLTWQASIAARVAGVMPGTTAEVLSLVNRVLPGSDGATSTEARHGYESRSAVSDSPLTALGESAADDLNQR
jgi:NAD(P)-dependent dehydrogenase (short-subunit alcohol dehydrogenase family)